MIRYFIRKKKQELIGNIKCSIENLKIFINEKEFIKYKKNNNKIRHEIICKKKKKVFFKKINIHNYINKIINIEILELRDREDMINIKFINNYKKKNILILKNKIKAKIYKNKKEILVDLKKIKKKKIYLKDIKYKFNKKDLIENPLVAIVK